MSDQPSKLIFAGLDNAGKTTIYKATMEEMSLAELEQQRPTRGIERHAHDFLDHDFAVWDLGGQKNYREQYLSKPEVFNSTKALIFVVDIQDVERFDESYKYYEDILNILINVDPKPKIYVLFHKFDPDKSGQLRSHFYRATRMFRQADQKLNQKFKGYATSIYANSINLAVKRILFENFEEYKEPTGSVKVRPKTEVKKDQAKPPVPKTTDKKEEVAPSEKTSTKPETKVPDLPKTTPTPPPASIETKSEEFPKTETPGSAVTKEEVSTPAPSTTFKTPAPVPKIETSQKTEEPQVQPETPTVQDEGVVEEGTTEATEITEEPEEMPALSPEQEAEVQEQLDAATPAGLEDLSEEVVEKLTSIINKRMKETPDIVALSIISSEGKQALAVAKTEMDYDRLATLREVVSQLNPKQFFRDLTDIEYRGLGHFSLSDFDIYFARASDEYAIAVLATDVSTLMLQNAQRIVRSIRQGLGMVSDDEDDEDLEEGEDTKKGKRDLVSDLRGRLRSITGLDNLDG